MSLFATVRRVVAQLTHDHRTVALMLFVPALLMGLFAWMFESGPFFQQVGPILLSIFSFILMFLVTSIATLRERQSGTLERYMTTPASKPALIFGYAIAFSLFAVVQTFIVVAFAIWVCDLDIKGPVWALIVIAILNAICGTAFGLFASAFARTEFQAIQFFPVFVVPQILLGGTFVPVDDMPTALNWIAHCLPMTYSIKAVQNVVADVGGWDVWGNVIGVAAFAIGSLIISSFTLPRRTP